MTMLTVIFIALVNPYLFISVKVSLTSYGLLSMFMLTATAIVSISYVFYLLNTEFMFLYTSAYLFFPLNT